MSPIRRVVFLDADGKPVRPAPSQLTPVEQEVADDFDRDSRPQEPLVEFTESRAPAPAHASVHHTILPAPVGAAQALKDLRRSNAIRDEPSPVRRRKARRLRAAAKRGGKGPRRTGSRSGTRPRSGSRSRTSPAAKRSSGTRSRSTRTRVVQRSNRAHRGRAIRTTRTR